MGRNRLPWRASAAVAAAALVAAAPGWCADELPPPPPLPPASDTPPAAAPSGPAVPATPGRAAEASEQAASSSEARGAQEGAEKPQPTARIEQKRVGRRVSEVIVTPAGFTYHYTMTHLDDQDPGRTLLQPHPELSVPRFFRFDF